MAFEHIVQTRKSFGRTGKEHHSARRTVQAVCHAQKYLSGFVILLFDICLNGLRERYIAGLVALHNLVASLIDGYNMVVFVQDSHQTLC